MATLEEQRKYQREWLAKRRADWFAENGPCVDCGSWNELELDHVKPSQKVEHRIWSWKQSRRDAELAKCVVRCCPCHLAKSVTESPKGEDRSNSRLTWAQVDDIRNSALTHNQVAMKYHVSRSLIQKIRSGKRWKR